MIYSKYPLKVMEEVAPFPPIQNTGNPYDTEAAMHADQANQLEGYGYLVDGLGAFTYLGTVAGTAADYEGFGGGSGLDLRASNLAADLSTAEKDAIRLKIGTAISPAPFLDEVIPDSYLPSTTGMFKLKGAFFTENMTVTTTGGTVNYIAFNNDNDVDVNITTGATEGSFSVTINNGISKTFDGVLLIVLGTVYSPLTSEWINVIEPISLADKGLNLKTLTSRGSAQWNKIIDVQKDIIISFNFKQSPLNSSTIPVYRDSDRLYILDNVDGSVLFQIENERGNRIEIKIATRGYGTTIYLQIQFVPPDTIIMKYISGIWYLYKGAILVRTFTEFRNYSNNLRIEGSLRYYDIENIKYIETL